MATTKPREPMAFEPMPVLRKKPAKKPANRGGRKK